MSALTGEDKNEWIKKIRDCISENPLINATNVKKKVLLKWRKIKKFILLSSILKIWYNENGVVYF